MNQAQAPLFSAAPEQQAFQPEAAAEGWAPAAVTQPPDRATAQPAASESASSAGTSLRIMVEPSLSRGGYRPPFAER